MRNIIKTLVCAVLLALMGGCAATHASKREYSSPLMESRYVFEKTRNGDTVEIEKVEDKVGLAGGMGYGRTLPVYPAARPGRYIAVPNVTDGQRAMELVPGGRVVLVPVADTRQAEAIKAQQRLLEELAEEIQQLKREE